MSINFLFSELLPLIDNNLNTLEQARDLTYENHFILFLKKPEGTAFSNAAHVP